MLTAIGWIIMLFPIIKAFFVKVLPKLISKIRGVGGKLTGNAEGLGGGTLVLGDLALGEAMQKTGLLGAIFILITRIWGWLGRFPSFVKGLFADGGVLAFFRPALEFLVGTFKTPVLVFFSLFVSSLFPNIIEKFFLLVGAVSMKIFLFFFKIGKGVFSRAADQIGSGDGVVDEFRSAVLDSFDELPSCMVDVMGYVHLIENLGLLISTALLILVISVFRVVYGSFGVKPLGWFA